MELKQNIQNPPKTSQELINLYNVYYGTDTNSEGSILKKFELLKLICFLSQVMKNKDKVKYNTTLKVLGAIYNTDLLNCDTGSSFNLYLIKLSILCDDLLYGTTDKLPTPEGYKNVTDIVNRIKQLINEWLPF